MFRQSARKRGYTTEWDKARKLFLRKNPLCVECMQQGKMVPSTVVDHIKPHKGDMSLFWDADNWQSLCTTCHNSYKKRLEMTGKVVGCDENGMPLDDDHHWKK